MTKKVVFRVDASVVAGIGHVMRCLTIADALTLNGYQSKFICRDLPGNLIAAIKMRGYEVFVLPLDSEQEFYIDSKNPYGAWLMVHWLTDASQTLDALKNELKVDWLIVDHYALDARWEGTVRISCKRLLVLDDLANRPHLADALIDQTYGRRPEEYEAFTPQGCSLFCGSNYVLLRPEFDVWREKSLKRRGNQAINRILISLGGVDKDNISREILIALNDMGLPKDIEIQLVLGSSSPWIAEMQEFVKSLSIKIKLMVGVKNMAELLTSTDLAIGAAGSSTWERCYLGVPSLLVVLAENQLKIAEMISSVGAANIIMPGPHLLEEIRNEVSKFFSNPKQIKDISSKAAALIPNNGVNRLLKFMIGVDK